MAANKDINRLSSWDTLVEAWQKLPRLTSAYLLVALLYSLSVFLLNFFIFLSADNFVELYSGNISFFSDEGPVVGSLLLIFDPARSPIAIIIYLLFTGINCIVLIYGGIRNAISINVKRFKFTHLFTMMLIMESIIAFVYWSALRDDLFSTRVAASISYIMSLIPMGQIISQANIILFISLLITPLLCMLTFFLLVVIPHQLLLKVYSKNSEALLFSLFKAIKQYGLYLVSVILKLFLFCFVFVIFLSIIAVPLGLIYIGMMYVEPPTHTHGLFPKDLLGGLGVTVKNMMRFFAFFINAAFIPWFIYTPLYIANVLGIVYRNIFMNAK